MTSMKKTNWRQVLISKLSESHWAVINLTLLSLKWNSHSVFCQNISLPFLVVIGSSLRKCPLMKTRAALARPYWFRPALNTERSKSNQRNLLCSTKLVTLMNFASSTHLSSIRGQTPGGPGAPRKALLSLRRDPEQPRHYDFILSA